MWYKEPFFQVALPIIITFALAYWHNNKRFDDLRTDIGKRIDDMGNALNKRIDDLRSEMKAGFDTINKRLERLENPSSMIRRP